MKVLGILLLYSFVLLFFLSPDSYIRDLYYHADGAAFFMCGKAWMNGMVPYVDFTDSKGPLLWLFYGLGYLISHHSYIGVFWISIVVYTATLFTAYKLCRLFVGKDISAFSAASLPFFLFCFLYHFEVRAEDFCYPFIMLSLYCACRILKYRASDGGTYFKLSALMGACMMCCVLIKYNDGAMIIGLMAVVLYMAVRHKSGRQSFLGMVVGAVVAAMPFVVCFLIYGNLGAFVHEYFINTFETILNRHGGELSLSSYQTMLLIANYCLLGVMALGIYCFSKRHKIGYWLMPCFVTAIVCIGNYWDMYYYSALMPFSIILIMVFTEFITDKIPLLRKNIGALGTIVVILSMATNLVVYTTRKFTLDDETRQRRYRAEYVMSQIKKPKLFYYNECESGIGMPAGVLPACKHWIRQSGCTEEMDGERQESFRSGAADFVCAVNPDEEEIKEIEGCGYVYYYDAPRFHWRSAKERHDVSVFGRPGLRLPPEDFHVSKWDVWLKRNILGI